MPRGIPNKAATPSNGKPASKMDGVRRALTDLGNDAKPLDIQEHLKTKYKIKMTISTIYNYKSTILRKGGGKKKGGRKGRKLGRPKGAVSATSRGISFEDIQAVKNLVDQLGADKVRQLAEVLS